MAGNARATLHPDGAEVKEGVAAKLEAIWTIAEGGKDRSGRVYLGTNPGGLFRSEDGGESRTLVAGLWEHPSRKASWFGGGRDTPGIYSVLVDPRDSRHVLVGISCAGVFEAREDGHSWQPRNKGLRATFLPDPNAEVGHDPHQVMACVTRPDARWQQNHCGIFRSQDGAQSWTEVTQPEGPARFGFGVAVHERRPDTAWVVPAVSDERRMSVGGALRVCRTEDGGRTWKVLTRGLPQENCCDLVYRHALDLRGSSLAFGSTTGNLFVSDDGGVSWRCLGNYLPLIYSVGFAV